LITVKACVVCFSKINRPTEPVIGAKADYVASIFEESHCSMFMPSFGIVLHPYCPVNDNKAKAIGCTCAADRDARARL
jgi:hypothetical protein